MFNGVKIVALCLVIICASLTYIEAYSARRDSLIIAKYQRSLELNHAKIAREVVHRANWASVGTISVNEIVKDYPMVNIISVDDGNEAGVSTGIIRFLLTDLDFTGPDWQHNNKVTFMFTDEQTLNCKNSDKDPMEPTCARVMLSGQVTKLSQDDPGYESKVAVFAKRHPAAKNWIRAHNFYLCELNIQNIFVLDFYGGPHNVSATDYYGTKI